jgi:hypothetical protein
VVDGLLDQAKKRADELKVALENARPGIDSVAEAMRKLGITSDASLKETAASAKEAYEVMRSSGTASARELQEGFKKYAEAAIAANNGVASDTIKVEASMRGLAVQSDNTGKSIVAAMKQGSQATQQLTSKVDDATDALERQAAAAEKAAAAERKRRGVDESGFSADKNGNRIVMGNELGSKTGIYNFLKSAGVDNEAVARQLATEFTGGQEMTPYAVGQTSGYKKYAPNQYASLSMAVLAAAQKYTFGSEQQKMNMRLEAQDPKLREESDKRVTPAPLMQSPATAQNANTSSGKTYTVNINLNGKTTTVNTSSDIDAQRLIEVLKGAKMAAGG